MHRAQTLLRPSLACAALAALALGAPSNAQCPVEPDLQNYTGGGAVAIPGFAAGEHAAAILDVPASHYPIEIQRIRIGWGSAFGGQPQSLEDSLNIFSSWPPVGPPQFSVAGPVLNDGAINDFDITIFPGNRVLTSGPFTVSLQLFNASSPPFGPAPVHDGNGCQPGKNAIFAIPGGWLDACSLGVTGDWVINVVYRRLPSANFRNGGTNPSSYTASTAVLGGTFTATVDNNVAGQTTSALFAFDTPVTLTLGNGATLLAADLGASGEMFTGGGLFPVGSVGGVDSYSLPLPSSLTFCGLELFTQAVQIGTPPFELSNGQDLYVSD